MNLLWEENDETKKGEKISHPFEFPNFLVEAGDVIVQIPMNWIDLQLDFIGTPRRPRGETFSVNVKFIFSTSLQKKKKRSKISIKLRGYGEKKKIKGYLDRRGPEP